MAGKTNYLEDQVLGLMLRTLASYKPAGIYFALFTAAPTDAGGGTEVTGGSYARVAVSQLDANWSAPAGAPRTTQNVNAITFPAPTANWGTIVAWGIFDASTAGNLLYWALQTPNKTVNNGDPAPSFAAGAVTIGED